MKFTILAIPFMRQHGEDVGLAGRDPARFQKVMAQVRDQMVFAESIGFNGFCMTEHHMQVEGIEATTNPIMWNQYVANHTKNMRVGQLGMNLTAMNPIKVAEDIALLDHMTGGRAFAGFSRGNTARWTATMGQHIDITATTSDKSDADQRNRRALYENWSIVKSLWTDDLTSIDGEFWQVPKRVPWEFPPTSLWAPEQVDSDGILQKVGITPRPLQTPHPPIYAPFSASMETVRFWGREGAKMVNFVRREKEEFIPIVLDNMLEAAQSTGKNLEAKDVLALGGMLLMGETEAESRSYLDVYDKLWKMAYDAPPYHEPPGRMWSCSKQELQDDVFGLIDKYKVDEIFVWHHVGYFGDSVEMAALNAFSEAVIQPLQGR
jgi:alkanesulfonate monooxygenase SsuD/methylene tetrahydromethanopterin reductase-like flavin-dependent oxidoreductase (luciferase family)